MKIIYWKFACESYFNLIFYLRFIYLQLVINQYFSFQFSYLIHKYSQVPNSPEIKLTDAKMMKTGEEFHRQMTFAMNHGFKNEQIRHELGKHIVLFVSRNLCLLWRKERAMIQPQKKNQHQTVTLPLI